MNATGKFSIIHAIVFGLRLSSAYAQAEGSQTVPALVAAADVIVAGDISARLNPSADEMVTVMHVDRILKGNLPSGTHDIEPDAREPARSGASTSPPMYGLFFLRYANGQWFRAAAHGAHLPAAPTAFQRFPPTADIVCRVGAELVTVFSVPQEATGDPKNGMAPTAMTVPPAGAIGQAAFDPRFWVRATNLRRAEQPYISAALALSSVPDSCKQPYLLKTLDAPAPLYGKLWANAILWRMGDFSHFLSAVPYLMRPSQAATGTNEGLEATLETKPFPDRFAPVFVRLLQSTNLEIRRGASYQVSQIDTPATDQALPPMLHNPDPVIQLNAVSGVCLRTSACGGAAPESLAGQNAIPRLMAFLETWRAQRSPP